MFSNNPLLAAVHKVTGTVSAKTKASTPPTGVVPEADESDKNKNDDAKEAAAAIDDDEDDDDDLSGALRNMDIDRDYNALLRSSTISIATNPTTNNDHDDQQRITKRDDDDIHHDHQDHNCDNKDDMIQDLSIWKTRWHGRDEIFSANYRPSTVEEQEVQQLANSVGMIGMSSSNKSNPWAAVVQNLVGSALTSPKSVANNNNNSNNTNKNNTTLTSNATTSMTTEQVARLLLFVADSQHKEQQQPMMGQSIILQRGWVVVHSVTHPCCELVVLTHGFLLLQSMADPDATAATTATSTDDGTDGTVGVSGCCTELPSLPPTAAAAGGWLLASIPKLPSVSWNSKNDTTATYYLVNAAHLWQHVTSVHVGTTPNTFVIHVNSSNDNSGDNGSGDHDNDHDHNDHATRYTITCRNANQLEAWWDVLEMAVLFAYHRFVVPTKLTKRLHHDDTDDDEDDDDDDDEDETWSLGWQHRIIQRSLHAPAVTGDANVLHQMLDLAKSSTPTTSSSSSPPSPTRAPLQRPPGWSTARLVSYPAELLDALDTYQSWTPLHYAAYHNHVAVAKLLLEAGANPKCVEGTSSSTSNTTSSDPHGRTPLYLAERYRFAEMKKLLESYGARPSTMARNEEKGALFRSVAAVEEKKKHDKQQKERQAAAYAAAQQQHAMQALQERGQRIEQLDDKTQELQQNAHDYRDMAKTLKDQAMQKKWYQM